MKRFFYRTFNIDPQEGLLVLLLIFQSFFLGVFYGVFDISASALFLEAFPSSMLPKAFVISGVAGIIMTAIYTRLQNTISFKKLAVFTLIFIAVATLMLRLGYSYTQTKWLPFSLMVMLGPLNIVAILTFWGMAGRLFTLRQGKRLFGLVDSGQVFGVIVSSYAVPVVLLVGFSTKNLLFICVASLIAALVFQIAILAKFNFLKSEQGSDSKKESKSFVALVKNKFVFYMAIFVMLSMIGAFFIYYLFLQVTNAKYPDSAELAKFLGIFTGTLMVFSFIFKTFIYGKIMQTYSLKTSMLILPFLLLIFTFLAIGTGLMFGYSAETSGFMLFFMMISLSRLFSRSLRESLEQPSFKILYLSLDAGIRYDIQARIDGVVNEFAALFSGIILAGLGMLTFIKPLHYSIILAVVLAVWIFITIKLYSYYRKSLVESLTHNKSEKHNQESNFSEKIDEILHSGQPEKISHALDLLNDIRPIKHDVEVSRLLSNARADLKQLGLDKIKERELIQLTPKVSKFIKTEEEGRLVQHAEKTLDYLLEKKLGLFSKTELLPLVKSSSDTDRERAAKIIADSDDEIFYPMLISLLRDHSFKVKVSAIKGCAKIKLTEVTPVLIELLSTKQYKNYAAEALVLFGQEIIDVLDLSFFKSDLDTRVQIKIVEIIGQIGGEKAITCLINKLIFIDSQVVSHAIKSLSKCHYTFKEEHFVPIRQAIEKTISNIAWDMSTIANLDETNTSAELQQALEEEVKQNYDQLYRLLSLIYDAKMIWTARENIENGSSEGIGYALELLDLYISEDLKPMLFPLFENISQTDRIKLLQNFFPLEKEKGIDLLYTIISRDINCVNNWIKACAIYNLQKFKTKARNDLVAHLFNRDYLLFETAGNTLHSCDPDTYVECCKRVPVKRRNELDFKLIISAEKKRHLLFEKILFLKSSTHFKKLTTTAIIEIAKHVEDLYIAPNQILFSKNQNQNQNVYIVLSGTVNLYEETQVIQKFKQGDILCRCLFVIGDSENAALKTETDCTFYIIKWDVILSIMADFSEMVDLIIDINNSRAQNKNNSEELYEENYHI